MANRLDIYRCEVCTNVVWVIRGGEGDLVCCGQPMSLYEEKKVDAAKERHFPVIEKIPSGFKVRVGSVAHPMEKRHYVEWIELVADGSCYRQFLEPGDTPEVVFVIEAQQIAAHAYCNLHGFW